MTKRRLVIAIDCDDVLVNATEYLVKTYNCTFGTSVESRHAHTSNNPEWEAERYEVFSRLHAIQLTDDYAGIAPDDQTVRSVKKLAMQHELHLVTARSPEVMAVTGRMVDDYFPGCFASIEHVGADTPKGEYCAAISADVLIDDNLKNLDAARTCGISHLLWYGEYEWQVASSDTPYATRCLDWVAVEAEIERITT